ncbi:MAG: response regulator transcription factor [Chitinophagaceae bacterium]|nr:response regulator transcription factor [Chitinophagaceae bacterium]MCA6483343.1 response regulator transcription factor [Chitinophagaceae bacterium]MCA6513308.1 response regulator transcription factor [Chitinophagaceae bacterium]
MKTNALNVLLVDDVNIVLQKMKMFLSIVPSVNRVDTADSADKAYLLLESNQPQLVVLDVNMPGTSGIDMLKKIRSSERPQPVVVMLTNQKEKIYKDTCLSLGADYYLDKSKDFLCLPEIIRELSAKRA